MDRLLALSDDLAAAVQQAGRAVFAVHARPRIPSTGVHWRPGLVVTANHTVQVDDAITVQAPAVPSTDRERMLSPPHVLYLARRGC